MRVIPITFTILALAFLAAHLCLGPIYFNSDVCACGQHRTWLSFDENPQLKSHQFFLKITDPGDLTHHHQFSDPQYYKTSSALGYTGIAFGLAAIIVWFRPCTSRVVFKIRLRHKLVWPHF